MKRSLAETVVRFLSFSGDRHKWLSAIAQFTQRDWKQVLQWMDDTGLAFYFMERLKDEHVNESVPSSVLSRLERNFASNQLRIEMMARRFEAINRELNAAGVQYTVVKGFSLVPQFCPWAALRHQADLDYLVHEKSLPAARRVLIEAGYRAQRSRSSRESIFVSPGRAPSRSDEQYSPRAPHAVEFHTDIWDNKMHGLLPIPDVFSMAQKATYCGNDSAFPALSDADAFLLQVVHACRHIFTQWIRMSCLYEIGYFLHRRSLDMEMWSEIEQRVGNSEMLREFVVIVTEMSARIFGARIPQLVQGWGAEIRLGPRAWIDHYSMDWAFSGLPVYEFSYWPSSKLALFLHQQYACASRQQGTEDKGQPAPSRLSRMAMSLRGDPPLVLNLGWWRHQHLLRRSGFYVLAELRYLVEIPRWRWLNRSQKQSIAPAPLPNESFRSRKAS